MKTKISGFVVLGVAGLACSAAFAGVKGEKPGQFRRMQRISPVSITYRGVTYPYHAGGLGDDAVLVFENGTTAATGLFFTGSLPRAHVMDRITFTPGPGAGQPVLITSMVVPLGATTVTMPNQNCEMEVHLWNSMIPANTPVNTAEAGTGIRLNFAAPAAGWVTNTAYISNPVDLTMLPGGGLPTTSADIGVDFSYFIPAGTVPAGYNPDFSTVMWSQTGGTGPTVGSDDLTTYWRDASGDGIFQTGEARSFAAPAEANFVMSFTGIVSGGGPTCYANCDGSTVQPILNVNDFICFQTKYAQNDTAANCDGSTVIPVLNVNDFICFQTKYAQGCP